MVQIATTKEQSDKLISLGLDVNTADMYWVNYENKTYLTSMDDEFDKRTDTYAWSLSALLGLIKPVNENSYTIQGTLDGGAIISFEEVTSIVFQEDNILDAVFEMVCYLIEMNLLDN